MDGVTTNVTGATFHIPSSNDREECLVQIDISSTITVVVNGRVNSSAAWVEVIPAKTASEIVPIAWVPELQAVTSGVSGGTASVRVAVP